MENYFARIGHPIPTHTNPAEFLLDIVSSDFGGAKEEARERVHRIQSEWTTSAEAQNTMRQVSSRSQVSEKNANVLTPEDMARPNAVKITQALLHRLWIKSYRDVVAYGIRIAMYLGEFPSSPPLCYHDKNWCLVSTAEAYT